MPWRDTVIVHTEADKYPLLKNVAPAELKELADDIAKHGLREKVIIIIVNEKQVVLDGRNRLDAMEQAGVPFLDKRGAIKKQYVREYPDGPASKGLASVASWVKSLNLHRRHLSKEERQQRLDDALVSDPSKSNAELARLTGFSDKTVAKVRRGKEASSDIPKITHPKTPKTPRKRKDDPVRTVSGDVIDLAKASEKVKAQLDAAAQTGSAETEIPIEDAKARMDETASPPIAPEESKIPERALSAEELSDDALTAFKEACVKHCLNMNSADLKAARVYLNGNDGAGKGTWARARVAKKTA